MMRSSTFGSYQWTSAGLFFCSIDTSSKDPCVVVSTVSLRIFRDIPTILRQDCSTAGIAWSVIPRGKPTDSVPRKILDALTPSSHRCASSGHFGCYIPLRLRQMSQLRLIRLVHFNCRHHNCQLYVFRSPSFSSG